MRARRNISGGLVAAEIDPKLRAAFPTAAGLHLAAMVAGGEFDLNQRTCRKATGQSVVAAMHTVRAPTPSEQPQQPQLQPHYRYSSNSSSNHSAAAAAVEQ